MSVETSTVRRPERAHTLIAVTVLGFASGLPLALSNSTLQAWCTVSGLSLKTIGAMQLVGFSYIAKFLWAPLLDRYRLPWLGRRRGWMLLMQVAIIAALIAMAGSSPQTSLTGIVILACALVFFSATQDTAIDAYRTDPLCSRSVTPRLADFIFRAGASSIADAWRLRVPTLLLAAGSDRLVDPSGSRDFSNGAWATKQLTARFFDTLFHELFNETETGRHQVLAQLLEWLRRTPL